MNKMHKNELEITEGFVKDLLKQQCPDYGDLNLVRIPSSGTVHALFRLGEQHVIRLPRIEASSGIEKEWAWLKQLAPHLNTPISVPIFHGQPSENYPWPWLISHFHQGANPDFEHDNEHHQLAIDLSEFLNQFHTMPVIEHAPLSRRGVPLRNLNAQTRKEIAKIGDEFDANALTQLWENLCVLPDWQQLPVWVHGDFLPGNILVHNQKISAVIDFSDVGTGDPACDLVIAWALLKKSSRKNFKAHLHDIDENTWKRGKGWALSIAAIMLPYYKNANPEFAKLARRILTEISESE
jgi:aminoglycoside phosphotransferase (APT) family kinase protein